MSIDIAPFLPAFEAWVKSPSDKEWDILCGEGLNLCRHLVEAECPGDAPEIRGRVSRLLLEKLLAVLSSGSDRDHQEFLDSALTCGPRHSQVGERLLAILRRLFREKRKRIQGFRLLHAFAVWRRGHGTKPWEQLWRHVETWCRERARMLVPGRGETEDDVALALIGQTMEILKSEEEGDCLAFWDLVREKGPDSEEVLYYLVRILENWNHQRTEEGRIVKELTNAVRQRLQKLVAVGELERKGTGVFARPGPGDSSPENGADLGEIFRECLQQAPFKVTYRQAEPMGATKAVYAGLEEFLLALVRHPRMAGMGWEPKRLARQIMNFMGIGLREVALVPEGGEDPPPEGPPGRDVGPEGGRSDTSVPGGDPESDALIQAWAEHVMGQLEKRGEGDLLHQFGVLYLCHTQFEIMKKLGVPADILAFMDPAHGPGRFEDRLVGAFGGSVGTWGHKWKKRFRDILVDNLGDLDEEDRPAALAALLPRMLERCPEIERFFRQRLFQGEPAGEAPANVLSQEEVMR